MPDRPIPTPETGRGTRRRAVLQGGLGGGLLLLLTGCRLRVGAPPRRPPHGPAPTDADDASMGTAADQARRMSQLYDAAAIARPDLRAPLARLAADHRSHLRVLTGLGADATAPTPSGTATSSPSFATPTARNATSVLSAAERSVLTSRLALAQDAGPDVARLFASMAACGSAHIALLARLPGTAAAKAQDRSGLSAERLR